MASPTTPTHGKLAAVYLRRENGFKGAGLNDLTWGSGYAGAASAYFEVVIDGVGTGTAGVDTFKWRQDGGAWTEEVDITGAAQALADSQTVTFGATTGHTADDQWTIGHLVDEATTESGSDAQITDSDHRILNPNSAPTWTDDGGESVLITDFTRGKATFSAAVGNVVVDGNNAWIVRSGLQQVGYLIGWSLSIQLDVADANRCGQHWKEGLPGQAGGSGSCQAHFIGTQAFFELLEAAAGGSPKYAFLELFNYDPDQDQSGDRMLAWAVIGGININAPIGAVVQNGLDFQVLGIPSFVANS